MDDNYFEVQEYFDGYGEDCIDPTNHVDIAPWVGYVRIRPKQIIVTTRRRPISRPSTYCSLETKSESGQESTHVFSASLKSCEKVLSINDAMIINAFPNHVCAVAPRPEDRAAQPFSSTGYVPTAPLERRPVLASPSSGNHCSFQRVRREGWIARSFRFIERGEISLPSGCQVDVHATPASAGDDGSATYYTAEVDVCRELEDFPSAHRSDPYRLDVLWIVEGPDHDHFVRWSDATRQLGQWGLPVSMSAFARFGARALGDEVIGAVQMLGGRCRGSMNMLLSKAITLVIVLTHFVSFGAAGAAHGGTVATPDAPVPVPHYCSEIEDGIDTASALQRQLICGALRSLHRGDLESAINGLDAAGSIRLHEAPNTGAFSFLAAALHGKGEIERAESAPDTAYVLILIDMGVLVCDVREDFRVARDPRTDGLDETVLENAGARMCGPMFATPDFWKKSPAGERALSRAVEEFEWARSRTKLGRPLP